MAAAYGIPVADLDPEPSNSPPMPREVRLQVIARALETTTERVRGMDENDLDLEILVKRAEQAAIKRRSDKPDARRPPGSVVL